LEAESDPLLPTFHKAFEKDGPAFVTLTARLDLAQPLSEARWVRSSERNAWCTLPSLGLAVTEEQELKSKCGWFDKIRVMDPELVSLSLPFPFGIVV
jgi:hypothetical protein